MKTFLILALLFSSQSWASWSLSSYNIRNFSGHTKVEPETDLAELGSIIKDFKSDVMGFVEVVNVSAFEKLIKLNLPGYKVISTECGGFGKQKLAIVYNPKNFKYISSTEDISFSGHRTECGSLRSALILTLEHISTKKEFVFAAFHLKAWGSSEDMSQRWMQYEQMAKLEKKFKNKNFYMLGDLNTTGYIQKNQDFTKFNKLLSTASMFTISEQLSCTAYWEGSLSDDRHQSSVLDHIILREDMRSDVDNIYYGAHCARMNCQDATPSELGVSYESVSDHCPIQVTFK